MYSEYWNENQTNFSDLCIPRVSYICFQVTRILLGWERYKIDEILIDITEASIPIKVSKINWHIIFANGIDNQYNTIIIFPGISWYFNFVKFLPDYLKRNLVNSNFIWRFKSTDKLKENLIDYEELKKWKRFAKYYMQILVFVEYLLVITKIIILQE